jgi:DNA polymerase-3 subunit delta'
VNAVWDVVGHEWAVTLFQRQIAAGDVSHAYLLCGPDGIGKEHMAITLAAALACTGEEPPCGECSNCRRLRADEHPDLRIVRGSNGTISIDEVRDLRRFLTLSPYQASRRIALLIGFDGATTEASNALLKSLEEPPARSVLILTAESLQALLPTILSRCQVFRLRRLPRAAIEEALRAQHQLPVDRAATLARLADGNLAWAVSASRDESVTQRLEQDVSLAIDLCRHGRAYRLSQAEELSKRDDLPQLLDTWSGWWRDVLLMAAGQGEMVAHQAQREALQGLASVYGVGQAVEALRSIDDALDQIEHHVNPRLALETMLLRWRRQRQSTVKQEGS